MRTEAHKNFTFGFVLTEPELRRIVTITEEQLGKVSDKPEINTTIDIKYRNGVLATTSSMDEVFSQENHGSAQIVELKAKWLVKDRPEENYVSVQFNNLEYAADPQNKPITFAVRGESRDWAFVTSSLLEERILKIKRLPLLKFLGGTGEGVFPLYFSVILAGLFLGGIITTLYAFPNDFPITTNPRAFSEELDAEIRAKGIKDPIEALIIHEQVLEKRERERAELSKKNEEEREQALKRSRRLSSDSIFLICILALPLTLFIVRRFLIMFYPLYNFCWGDYLDVFKKKESVRKFVIVVVIIGIIVSFIGGVLANLTRI